MQLQVIEGLPGANDGDICSNRYTAVQAATNPRSCHEAYLKAAVNSPVPKPSIPGMSSPKLQRKRLKIQRMLYIISKSPKKKKHWEHTPGFPSSEACSWTDGSAFVWTWGAPCVGWRGLRWHGWPTWSQLWAQDSFWAVTLPACRIEASETLAEVVVMKSFGLDREKEKVRTQVTLTCLNIKRTDSSPAAAVTSVWHSRL